MSRSIQLLRRLIVAIAIICLGLGKAGPASAADGTSLVLVAESATVPADGTATFTVEVTNAPPDSVIALDVYLPVDGDRAAVEAAMQGKVRGQQFFPGIRLDAATALGPDRRVTLTVPTSSDGRNNTFRLKTAGLYPVLISVLKGTTPIARLTTFLVRVDPASRPVNVAVVLPVDQAPTLQPDGSRVLDAATRARLAAIERLSSIAPTVPLTLAIRPDIIDALQNSTVEDRALATRLAAVAKRGQVLIDSAIAIDPSQAARSGLSDAYRQQVTEGSRIITDWAGDDAIDSGARFVSAPLDQNGLKLAREAEKTNFINLIVLPNAVTASTVGTVGPSTVSTAEVPTSETLAMIGDTGFADLLATRTNPGAAVNLFVAQLQALSPPPDKPLPGITLAAPPDWTAEAGGPLDLLVSRLANSGGLRPLVALEVRQQLRMTGTAITRTFRDATAASAGDIGGELALVNLSIASLASMMPTPPPNTNTLLTVASSTVLTAEQRAAYIAAAKAPTDAMQNVIDTPERQTFTVAAGKAAIPIRITSKILTPIKVKLHFTSDKADFTPNDQIVTLNDGLFQQDNMPINARNGKYPVRLEVLTPAGDQLLATGVYEVQAIAYGGLGLALSVGAGIVLVTWWISHARSTRRRKRARADAERHPSRLRTG
jgi:hypothetical protein